MHCHYCHRRVRLFNFQRSSLLKKVLPRCGACHRYVLLWVHKLALGVLALAASFLLLKLVGIL